MAQAAGFTCDVCGGFQVADKNSSSIERPVGWLSVNPKTDRGDLEHLDVCSNYCLAELGKLRWECESQNDGKTFKFVGEKARATRTITPEAREKMRENGRKRQEQRRKEAEEAARQKREAAGDA